MAKSKRKSGKKRAGKPSKRKAVVVAPVTRMAAEKDVAAAKVARREVEKEAKREAGMLKILAIGAVVIVVIIAMFLLFSQKPSQNKVTPEQIEQINREIAQNMQTTSGGGKLAPELLETLKICGGGFNRQFVQKTLIDDTRILKEDDGKFFGNFPRKINCNGKEYPYSLEIEDGWITTTYLDNVKVRSNITSGLVGRGLRVPKEDMEAGVFIVVVRNEGKLDYRYELQNESKLGESAGTTITLNQEFNGTTALPNP